MPPASAGASAAQARAELVQLLEPVIAGQGYDLEDVTVTRAGRRSLVRIVVDADGGIDLDAVSDVSRAVSETLDDELDGSLAHSLAGSYTLEVTSPGVDRPLTEPRHWRRSIGRLVSADVDGSPVTGRVEDVGDDGVTLEVTGRRQSVGWAALGKGRVQVEFKRAGGEDA